MRFLDCIALLAISSPLAAQTALHQQIADIAKSARGEVYVACSLPGTKLDCNFNPYGHPPMQSTFKLPLAIAVFQQIEAGKLSLDGPIPFLTSDLYKGSYSPLQEAHPAAGVDIPLRELLRLSVSLSDNIATDILLRTIGGTQIVQHSMDGLGLTGIHIIHTERTLHDDESLQYEDSAEPSSMVALLRRLADNSPLNPDNTALLNKWMTETPSAPHRIKGMLPPGVIVTHKTGTSGLDHGFYPATNDIGLITLPNGKRLAVAIFVTNAHADDATNEAVIARISKAVFDAAIVKK
jgi:beta-lactamase class A